MKLKHAIYLNKIEFKIDGDNFKTKEYEIIENGIKYFILEDQFKVKNYHIGYDIFNCELHREINAAQEYPYGGKVWYKYGKIHRTDGPALINDDGIKQYWLNNVPYPNVETNEEWILAQIIL